MVVQIAIDVFCDEVANTGFVGPRKMNVSVCEFAIIFGKVKLEVVPLNGARG